MRLDRICTPSLGIDKLRHKGATSQSTMFNFDSIPKLEPHDDLGGVALYIRSVKIGILLCGVRKARSEWIMRLTDLACGGELVIKYSGWHYVITSSVSCSPA